MLKMMIRMNENKITAEKKYQLDGITPLSTTLSSSWDFPVWKMLPALQYIVIAEGSRFQSFWQNCQYAEKQTWFMDNVSAWRFYDSDDADTYDDFNEEDLLNHYRNKHITRT